MANQLAVLGLDPGDQENVIEQLGSGLAAWRMPVAEFDGNSAWLEIASPCRSPHASEVRRLRPRSPPAHSSWPTARRRHRRWPGARVTALQLASRPAPRHAP
jgi:hypothetical protein